MTKLLMLGIYVGMLVASMVAGTKIIGFWGLAASATVFSYALTFLITDYIAEIYGKKEAQRFVYSGLLGMLLAALFFRVAIMAPSAGFYQDQETFEAILGAAPRFLVGGFCAYIISQLFDVWFFHRVRAATKGRLLWLRNNASTLCSQLIDSIIFITIAFYGVVDDLVSLILGQYIIKVGIAILDTPILYAMVALLPRLGGERAMDETQ